MIHCQAVSKSYRDHVVITAIDLRIESGICGLLGANGAGKSTLLKLMTGQVAPTAGTITIDDLNVMTHCPAVRRCMGVVPEELGLFETLTVLENLELTAPIYGLSITETRERSVDLLTMLDLYGARNRFVSQCSYGMRKKTALAMALLHNPKFLVLDEPFEGIDPSSSKVIQGILRGAAEHGVTIVLTSHNLPLIEGLTDRILILKDSTIAYDSSTTDSTCRLEDKYFQLAGNPAREALSWLRC